MTRRNEFIKDPDAVLDFKFDWAPLTNGTEGGSSDWLASGETISTFTITISPAGLTEDSSAKTDTNTSVTVWLSGGSNSKYGVTCHIVTSALREDDRTIWISVQDR